MEILLGPMKKYSKNSFTGVWYPAHVILTIIEVKQI